MKRNFTQFLTWLLIAFPFLLQAQLGDITDVTLTFTPDGGGDPVVAEATDTGSGLTVAGDIELRESIEYTLTIAIANGATDLGAVVSANQEDYLFFFAFAEELFDLPNGDGNVDNREDPVNYDDEDANGFDVGLATSWTTSCTEPGNTTDTFRVVLQYQMGTKSETSTATEGANEFDLTWNVTVVDNPDAPPCENEEEIITDVVLTFTSEDSSDVVTATAQDPDGDGPLGLEVSEGIELMESTRYTLSIELRNDLEGEDITEEIKEEDDEHQFFFSFGEELFDLPNGNGNIDNRDDPIIYDDEDENGLDVGLMTSWTTACTEGNTTDTFRVVLKHQPDIKSETSTAQDGGTDIDITWDLTIVDNPDAPPCENEEEIITDVVLTFTSEDSSDVVTATAQDPDGDGPLGLEVTEGVELMESTRYTLSIELSNELEGENITEEIREEDDEHQFFFSFGEGLFDLPNGNGNIDNRDDPIIYDDEDENGLDVGLMTSWTTACTEGNTTDTFRVVLKHQPNIKSETSTAQDGGTDIDITWDITIVDNPDAPPCENEEEIITDVVLTFTSEDSSSIVTVTAQDPDGEGPIGLVESETIGLLPNTTYTLSIELSNEIEGENITEEIAEEDDEHQFFFAWTEGIFTSPEGDGNIDNRDDPINYNDEDDNGRPLGLSTSWTTGDSVPNGTFQVILKHQPDIKSDSSTAEDGGTDIDLTFDVGEGIPTSTRDLIQEGGLTLWPNPASGQLNWSVKGEIVNELRLYDQVGRLILSNVRPAASVDLSSLAEGTYILMLYGDQKIWRDRVVIVR
ncbi:MAG: T9SS type A sorting domain-containing protein [Bacteroidota bacterium]